MSFWTVHGYFSGCLFILFLFLLPRTTMFFSLALTVGMVTWLTDPFGLTGHPMGILVALVGWVAWFLVPRFLVAIIATALYWSTNPILCIVSWFLACIILLAKLQASEEAEEQKEEEEEAARVAAEEELAKKNTRDPGAQSGRQRRQRPTQSPGQKVQQWWDVLGVNPSASAEVIKAAYRRVAKATHPDSAPDKKGDVDTFSKANEAYQKWLKGKDK